MDKVIVKKWTAGKKRWVAGASVLAVLAGLSAWGWASPSTVKVSHSKLTVHSVTQGVFEEYVPVNGIVRPLKTVLIDAAEGGRVEEKFVEEGAYVKQGDPILRLSNKDLLLEFMNRETSLLDQMNNMRNTRISIEQNHLQLKQQLLDVEHSWNERRRDYERNAKLMKEGVIASAEFERIESEFRTVTKKKSLLLETIKNDSVFKAIQVQQLESSSALIQRNLDMVKSNLDNLVIKAPISGQLTALKAEIGENKTKGENIGQVDMKEGFKITASVDEHYISRVIAGQKGEFRFNDTVYRVMIKSVHPEVRNGHFEVEMIFEGKVPSSIRPGQTLQIKVTLSSSNTALLLPKGAFYGHTGGAWVYIVQDNVAVKRDVVLGRQNPLYYEVIGGLEAGDKVITSGYEMFNDASELHLE